MARLILAAALAATILAAPKAPAPPLKFSASAEPKVARSGQPVSVRVRWVNSGGAPLLVNRRGLLGHEVVLAVRRRGRPVVALTTPPDLGAPKEQDFIALPPGGAIEYEYPLMPSSGEPWASGSYDVRVVYVNDAAPPNQRPFVGKLEAKTAFRVLPALVK